MLASPLYPSPSFSPRQSNDDATQYRPAKDMEAFNSLLPPAIEFVEGSSSGALILGEGKYEPINGSPMAKSEHPQYSSEKPLRNSISSPTDITSLYSGTIDTSWPSQTHVGRGFNNTGNTCFLNSALQCLVYTPPLVRVLAQHLQHCKVKTQAFCMACSLRQTILDTRNKAHSFAPYLITTKLPTIAKHMRRGRQEDSHEFLRYAIDALQKSCLAGYPPKLDPKLAETTWVHRIFGGRLRSRVTCQECKFNSDTFDSILDLSIDIYGVNSVRDALRKFVAVDHLKGANKYLCEKCKKFVTAEKQFTIDSPPAILTVHLKRFSPMGRKIGHSIKYEEKLSLQPYMSEDKFGPTYSLYGVISHAGGGPNSGHYYAHIKDGAEQWYEMNDELVTRIHGAPVAMKNAYMLFYVREKGQTLESAINLPARQSPQRPLVYRSGVALGMKKRKIIESEDEAEDTGFVGKFTAKTFGPLSPSALPSLPNSPSGESNKKQKLDSDDPQAQALKLKIALATASGPAFPGSALLSLSQYDEDDEDDGIKISKEDVEKAKEKLTIPVTPKSVPAVMFYSDKTRGAMDSGKDNAGLLGPRPFSSTFNRSPDDFRKRNGLVAGGGNPYNRLKGGNNLDQRENLRMKQYGKKAKKRAMII